MIGGDGIKRPGVDCSSSKLGTGVVFFAGETWYLEPEHPEKAERVLDTWHFFNDNGILESDAIRRIEPERITNSLIESIQGIIPDLMPMLSEAHYYAAGSALAIARSRCEGHISNGFAFIRPPGHHTFRMTYGHRGFCSINNLAIVLQTIRFEYDFKKIVIIDTDVHHGDGTQNFFWHDPDVLFISIHQDGRTQYPGTGFTSEAGGPQAFGTTINLPLPPESGDTTYLSLIDKCVLPIITDFGPDLIINSAGQDTHFADPLGSMQVTASGYAEMIRKIKPDIIILEGGYASKKALPYAHLAMMKSLMNIPPEEFSREPLLPESGIREPAECKEWVAKLTDKVFPIYFERMDQRKKLASNRLQFYERNFRVFYDTDGIVDWESEMLKKCDRCSGLLHIQSEARFPSGSHLKTSLISVPWHSCEKCRAAAEEMRHQQKKPSSRFDFLLYHDLQYNMSQQLRIER